MENQKMKILIVEFYTWHDECLLTTCKLLEDNGIEVSLALNQDLEERTAPVLTGVASGGIRYFPFRKGVRGYAALFQLHQHIRKGRFTHVYLNTASGSEAWKFFILPLPKQVKAVGTLHNIVKLSSSIGQKIITRSLHGYVLLSDILQPFYRQCCTLPSVSVYPIIHPHLEQQDIRKNDGEIWIAIPGAVALSRRDYITLVEAGKRTPYAPHIKFIILGNICKADGHEVRGAIKAAGMESNFVFFDRYVAGNLFYSYIQKSDYLMPLVHPSKKEYAKYLSEKISGTYNQAYAYKKPMLCPEEMSVHEDFKDSSLFYDINRLAEYVNNLQPPLGSSFFHLPKWEEQQQAQRLVDFLSAL